MQLNMETRFEQAAKQQGLRGRAQVRPQHYSLSWLPLPPKGQLSKDFFIWQRHFSSGKEKSPEAIPTGLICLGSLKDCTWYECSPWSCISEAVLVQ